MSRPISRKLHGIADYSYVPLVAAAPRLIGFEAEDAAVKLCRVLSASALSYSMLTRAEWGAVPLISYSAHLKLDIASGVLALAAPWLFGFTHNRGARNTFLAMGAAGLLAGLLSEPEEALEVARAAPAPRRLVALERSHPSNSVRNAALTVMRSAVPGVLP